MSFILDALKKSEAERNRKTGPVLMDMRIARARRRLPAWVWVIAIVLLANLALLGYALLRSTKPPESVASVAATPAATPIVVTPVPGVGNATSALPPPTLPTTPAATTGGVIMQSNAVVTPATPGAPYESQPATAISPEDAALPSDEDLRQSGITVPELRLSLHVYDSNPANRFVLLNSSRLFEGQETADGVRVERILPTGVILAWRGRRFLMSPGN